MNENQKYAQMFRDVLGYADQLMATLPEPQYIGILVTEADKGNLTAKHLLLCHQHALAQIDEAERFAFYGAVSGDGGRHDVQQLS